MRFAGTAGAAEGDSSRRLEAGAAPGSAQRLAQREEERAVARPKGAPGADPDQLPPGRTENEGQPTREGPEVEARKAAPETGGVLVQTHRIEAAAHPDQTRCSQEETEGAEG